jgi:hypothetical protein
MCLVLSGIVLATTSEQLDTKKFTDHNENECDSIRFPLKPTGSKTQRGADNTAEDLQNRVATCVGQAGRHPTEAIRSQSMGGRAAAGLPFALFGTRRGSIGGVLPPGCASI